MRSVAVALLLPVLLAACSMHGRRVAWETDGAPLLALDAADVVDAVPRPDPILDAGNTSPYVVHGVEYRVLDSASGYRQIGTASWYGTKFHGNPTANGEIFDLYLPTAAHRSLPIPCYLRVTNLRNGRSVVVRVNDRGPFHDQRLIDLSYAAAVKLDMVEEGTAPVRLEAITLAGVADHRGTPDKGYLYLQLGAFSSTHVATDLRNQVAALVDVPVTVTPVDIEGRRLSRVRLGPVDEPGELQRLRELLQLRGFAPGMPLP